MNTIEIIINFLIEIKWPAAFLFVIIYFGWYLKSLDKQ